MHQNNLISIKETAKNLMFQHGLHDWDFKFCRGIQLHGKANLTKKTIEISKIHALYEQNQEVIRDTILHEIAHALDYLNRGFSNHDAQWKTIANTIGCVPSFRGKGTSHLPFSKKELHKWIGTCPKCKKKYYRNRRRKVACGVCCKEHNKGKFSKKYLLKYIANPECIKI